MTLFSAESRSIHTPIFAEIGVRMGLVPNFFRSTATADGLLETIWALTKAVYLDSPLPPLFKERLYVHLSRYCRTRYCIVRHVGFLIGLGHRAGDPACPAQSIDDALALLRRKVATGDKLEEALARLEDHPNPGQLPQPGTQYEADLFDALTTIFVHPGECSRARAAVRDALGTSTRDLLIAFLAFVRTGHFWADTHPEIPFEPDVVEMLRANDELALAVLDTKDADRRWMH